MPYRMSEGSRRCPSSSKIMPSQSPFSSSNSTSMRSLMASNFHQARALSTLIAVSIASLMTMWFILRNLPLLSLHRSWSGCESSDVRIRIREITMGFVAMHAAVLRRGNPARLGDDDC